MFSFKLNVAFTKVDFFIQAYNFIHQLDDGEGNVMIYFRRKIIYRGH